MVVGDGERGGRVVYIVAGRQERRGGDGWWIDDGWEKERREKN